MDQCTRSVCTQMNLGQPSSKGFFFPSSGMAQKKKKKIIFFSFQREITKKATISLPFCPHAGAQKGQHRYGWQEGGHTIPDFPFAEDFGAAGWLCRQLSRNCQLECQCREVMLCTETYVLSHRYIKPLSSLQERFYPNSRISKVWKLPECKIHVKISPFDFITVAR